MSTKVKGEAIKDGSINLKSFDTFTKGTVFNLKDPIVSITKESKYPYTENVIYALYNDKAYRINKGEKAIINQGPPVYISYINNEVYIEDTTNFIPSTATITLFAGTTITIPTPDWNAKEGEAGYIENKPFEKIIFDGIIKSDNIITYDYNIYSSSVYISCEGQEILHFAEYGEEQEITLDWPNIKVYWNGTDQIIITNLSDEPADAIKNYISVYGYNRRLLSSSINDGVIKTTPQTLADNDKNQALTNLGIDPVVWKYLTNPFIIKIETECYVPEELVGSPVDSGSYPEIRYEWKYLNPAMYIGYDDMAIEYDTVILSDGEILTLEVFGHQIFIGENFKILYI